MRACTGASGKNFEDNLSEQSFEVTPGGEETAFEFTYTLDQQARLWDEFDPNLYQLTLSMEDGDEHREDFGFRKITFRNRQLVINGRPAYLRGTLECAIFPEAAFEAADEMGVYLQVEAASWANQSTTLGDGKPVDQYIQEASERIVQAYGNHPSFLMMAYGNEPGGDHYRKFLSAYVNAWKAKDNRRLYTAAAGWPDIPENDFHVLPALRIQAWGQELNSIINATPPATNYDFTDTIPDDTIAVISHEIGQWCVYPDFKEIERYTGVLKAKNFELFRESLEAHQMGALAEDFLMASGK